jgi:DNA repair protein RadC
MTELTRLSVKDWSPEDRPREKLIQKGVSSLSDSELLAIVIGSGNKDESAVELSQRILRSVNNNINQLGKSSVNYLISNFKGIGEAKAISIVAALELGKRRQAEPVLRKNKISCSKDIYNYFRPMLCDLPHEEFWALFLNSYNRIIGRIKISQGGVSETIVDGKIVYKEAVIHLASKIVFCHNHPSGNPAPSQRDDAVTLSLKRGVELLDINFVDHVIVADDKYYSYADERRI